LAALINQHSFLFAAVTTLVLVSAVLFRDGARPQDWFALGALSAGLALAYGLLRPGPPTHAQIQEVDSLIGAGRPVLLEFQSPY
jgi:hypothetical protein